MGGEGKERREGEGDKSPAGSSQDLGSDGNASKPVSYSVILKIINVYSVMIINVYKPSRRSAP